MASREEAFTLVEQARRVPAVAHSVCTQLNRDFESLFGLSKEVCQSLDCVEITGCGDSWMSSNAVLPLYRELAGLEANAEKCIELSRFEKLPKNCLVIGVSISGGVVRTREALLRARKSGAKTALVTNSPNSVSAQSADYVFEIRLPGGLEHGYGLHSYTCSVCVLVYVGMALAVAREQCTREYALQRLEAFQAYLLAYEECFAGFETQALNLLGAWKDLKAYQFFADGNDFSTAYFSCANIVEEIGALSTGGSIADWFTEANALAEPGRIGRVFIVNPGPNQKWGCQAAAQATAQGSPCILLTDGDGAVAPEGCAIFHCPPCQEPWMRVAAQHIPISILVGYIRKARGLVSFCAEDMRFRNAKIHGGQDRIKGSRLVVI